MDAILNVLAEQWGLLILFIPLALVCAMVAIIASFNALAIIVRGHAPRSTLVIPSPDASRRIVERALEAVDDGKFSVKADDCSNSNEPCSPHCICVNDLKEL